MRLVIDRILDEAHARQLPALIDEWSRATDERRWIARALRIDLALLTERPELVIPCLYRRCAIADEDGFYAKRAPAPDLAALRATVRSFTSHVTSPWLRALRPPTIPIDGAVIEEYRTSANGELWISDDGEQIGVGDVAWERSTGRRVTVTQRPVADAPRTWQTGRANHWGRMVLEGPDDTIIDVELRRDQIV